MNDEPAPVAIRIALSMSSRYRPTSSSPDASVPSSRRMQSLRLLPENANTTTSGGEDARSSASHGSPSHGARPPWARGVTSTPSDRPTAPTYGSAWTTSESP